MARPIKETPPLKGKDAQTFVSKMANSRDSKLSKEEMQRIEKNFQKFKAIEKH